MESEDEFIFRNANLPQRCYTAFLDLRNQNKFCDMNIKIGTCRISAHRVILASSIPLFSNDEISVPDIDPTIFKSFVDYAYTCELKITMDNVRDLLLGSCVMQMKDVQGACCDFLLQRLEPQNVLSFRNLTCDFDLPQLEQCIDLYVKENFHEVSKTEDFLNLPFTYVKDLISKDDLNVDSEEKVLVSVLRWVKASVSERKSQLPELLRQVRLVLLDPLYLTDLVYRENLIRISYVIRDIVDEAKNYILLPEMRRRYKFQTKPRQFIQTSEAIQQTGAKVCCLKVHLEYSVMQTDLTNQTNDTNFIQRYRENTGCVGTLKKKIFFFLESYTFAYDPESKKPQLHAPFTWSRKLAAVASLRNKMFVCGGYTKHYVASKAVECFDPVNDEWTQMSSLQKGRWSLNLVSLGDYIYALGGRDLHNVYDTVERYNFPMGKWRYVSSMLTGRHEAGAAVLNGKVYACGGYTTFSGSQCAKTAEVYDPAVNKWVFISSLNTARRKLTLIAFSEKLYAVGGFDGKQNPLNSCEIYDLETNIWKYGPTNECFCNASGIVVM